MRALGCVLITGTAQGIGHALLARYVARGVRVIAVDRQPRSGLSVSSPLVMFRQLDICDEAAVDQFVGSLEEEQLPDLCIFNAAIHEPDNDLYPDYQTLKRVIAVDQLSTLHFLSLLMPRLRQPATFLFVSSGVITFPNPAYLGYFISKQAVTSTFDLFARTYRQFGFRFQTVVLGPTASPMLERSRPPGGVAGLLRRWTTATPDDVADRIVAFAGGRRRRMYYRRSSAFVLWCARLAQGMLPASLKAYARRRPS